MKKLGLIALALVLALGAMGGALAYWNEELTITGDVNTGSLDVGLKAYLGMEFSPYVTLSPWIQWWPGSGVQTHTFTVSGVYPSFGDLFFVMYVAKNTGTIPAKVKSVDIVKPAWLDVATYSEGVPEWVKAEAIAEVNASTEIPEEEKAEILAAIEEDWAVGDILGTTFLDRTAILFITLHVKSDVEVPENGQGDVTVTTVFTQFNEVLP